MNEEFDRFSQAVAKAGTPAQAHQALCVLTGKIIGVRLFTLMTFDRKRGEAKRIFSNMPEDYPVSGTKAVDSSDWTNLVLDQRKTFVANTLDDIAKVFPDYELIDSLGCQSCINIPVEVGGEVLGTLNCLHEKDHYTAGRIATSEALKLPGAVCLLMEIVDLKREASNG